MVTEPAHAALHAIAKKLSDSEPCCGCCGGEDVFNELRRELFDMLDVVDELGLLGWRIVDCKMHPSMRTPERGYKTPPTDTFKSHKAAFARLSECVWWRVVVDER